MTQIEILASFFISNLYYVNYTKLFWLFSSQKISPNTKEEVSLNYNSDFPNYHSTSFEGWSVEITRNEISGLLSL